MACNTRNNWTKIISSFTIIFCIVYIISEILILFFRDNIDILENIKKYIKDGNHKDIVTTLFSCSITLNALWVITSIVLLVLLRKTEIEDYSIKKHKKLFKSYIVWIVNGFFTFGVNIAASIIFAIYYFTENNTDKEKSKEGSLHLLLLSSGFIIILVFFIISWIFIIVIARTLKKSFNEDSSQPVKRTVPLKPLKPALKPSKVPHLEENNIDRVRDWYKHYEDEKNKNANSAIYYSESNRESNFIPRFNGNGNNLPFALNSYIAPTAPPVPAKPPKPAPSPPNHQVMPGMNTNVLVNGVPSGTLRRQLPWSYMPKGESIPRRPLSPQSSIVSNFAPYVPAPDYNVKNLKANRRQEFSQPGWNQYL